MVCIIGLCCFFFKQKTAYEMRISDWSSDVCSSDLVHLGMATQTDAGLMVPVIRNAQERNVWQLATEIGRLAEAARTGKAKSDELSGSTLTITSLGPLGGIATKIGRAHV